MQTSFIDAAQDWVSGFAWGLTMCMIVLSVFWYSALSPKPKARQEAGSYVIEYYIPVVNDDIGVKRLSIADIKDML